MLDPIIINRNLPGKAALVWQVLTTKEHLSHWFLPLEKSLELDLVFNATFFSSKTTWQISRLVSLAVVEFSTKSFNAKGELVVTGKISWRMLQDNGQVTLNIADQSLTSSFPLSLLEKQKHLKTWRAIINKLEQYLEEVTGQNSY